MDMLATLPNEVLHHIFKDVGIVDVARLRLTCRKINGFLAENHDLFRDMYLRRFDPLRDAKDQNWEQYLHLLVKLNRIIKYDSVDDKSRHLTLIADTVDHFLKNAAPGGPAKNVRFLTNKFVTEEDLEAFFCQSTIYTRFNRVENRSFDERQASAKMHCLYGVPLIESWRPGPILRHRNAPHGYACSIVYDLRGYTAETKWGPFLGDGLATVDWERVEAIMILMRHNVLQHDISPKSPLADQWVTPFKGASPGSFVPITLNDLPEPAPPSVPEDPYNINGTYMRIICFLDFHDLHQYNFSTENYPPSEPRPPIYIQQAIRVLLMELEVTQIKYPGEDGGPGPDDEQFPVVYFKGISRAMHRDIEGKAQSKTRGTCRMTKEGEVRWTTYSLYWGEERWKSEGVQVGGINSGRGVFGHWFDKGLSNEGPAGPSAFWKISNEINTEYTGGEGLSFQGHEDVDDDDSSADEEQVEIESFFEEVLEEYEEVEGDSPMLGAWGSEGGGVVGS